MNMLPYFRRTAAALALTLIAASCTTNIFQPEPTLDDRKKQVVTTYSDIAFAVYEDSYNGALALKTALQAFTANPTQSTLEAARKAWLDARTPYGQTETYRLCGGPIDDDNGPEGSINAWPMDESYVDYVEGAANAGIINNPAQYPSITKALLKELNEQGGETNISTGYHAIEFLLWGQDLTAPADKKPGQRLLTDFTTRSNAERRKQYLIACVDLLIDDLKYVLDAWRPSTAGNYRARLTATKPDSALAIMLTGMGSLSSGELSGERMTVALESGDQEDEHSCFSDNTHNDIILNARGIQNIWLGTYTRTNGMMVKGTSLQSLVNSLKADVASEVTSAMANSIAKVQALQPPFDLEISNTNRAGNLRVNDGAQALKSQATGIVKAAETIGVRINID
jgi:putative iron-regulated protein